MMKMRGLMILVGVLLTGGVWAQVDQYNTGSIQTFSGSTNQLLELQVGITTPNNDVIFDEDVRRGYIGAALGITEASYSNRLSLSAGSALELDGNLIVGVSSSWNRVELTGEGAWLASDNAFIGEWETATGNWVRVSGAGASWTNRGLLMIGDDDNRDNYVVVTNGGSVVLGSLIVSGSENRFDLERQGTLTVTGAFDASQEGFNYGAGSTLIAGGGLSGFDQSLEDGRTLGIRGVWARSGETVFVGTNSVGNTLWVESEGDVVAGNLVLGAAVTSNNMVSVRDGGSMTLDVQPEILGTNNVLELASRGTLIVKDDFDASVEGFEFLSRGRLEVSGALSGMTNVLSSGRRITLNGSNAVWMVGDSLSVSNASIGLEDGAVLTSSGGALVGGQVSLSGAAWTNSGDLTLGWNGVGSALQILAGSYVTNVNAEIGLNSDGNAVEVRGSGSAWSMSGDLEIGADGNGNTLLITDQAVVSANTVRLGGAGGENNVIELNGAVLNAGGDLVLGSGSGNLLYLTNGAVVNVAGALTNASTLRVLGEAQVQSASYHQLATGALQFDGSNVLNVAGTASLDAGTTVEFTASDSLFVPGEIHTNLLIDASLFVVNGVTNPAQSNLVADIELKKSNLLEMALLNDSNDLQAELKRERIATVAGFSTGSRMEAVADAIDELATDKHAEAARQLALLGEWDGSRMNRELTQLYSRGVPTFAHAEGMLEGFKQVRQRGVMPESMWILGPQGPHLYGDQVQGWVEAYGSWSKRDEAEEFSAYDHNLYGVVVGVDKAYGEWLFGFAGGYASSEISQDDGDVSSADTGYGVVYASCGTSTWFGELNLGYGRSTIDSKSGTAFDTTAEFGAHQLGFYAGTGGELIFGDDQWFFTPSVALAGSWYVQDEYTEEADLAVPRVIEGYDRFSMHSELGLKVSYQRECKKMVLIPEVHGLLIHEFNTDEEQVEYRLVGSSDSFSFDMQAPVDALFDVGVGIGIWSEDVSGRVFEWSFGADGRFGDGYSASVLNAKLRCEF